MKIAIIPSDVSGRIECVLDQNVLRKLPDLTNPAQADVIVVPVSHYNDYGFNNELRRIRKPYVLVDMMEYYGQASTETTHLFGKNHAAAWNLHTNGHWQLLHEWVAEHPPILYMKRELLAKDASETVVPIEWPCYLPTWEIESKEAFERRAFEVFFNWGFSNCLRPQLHGQIFTESCRLGYEVISSFDHIACKENEKGRKWISIHSPHTHRTHIDEIVRRQAQSKLSLSLPGAGTVCFRSTEHVLHSVPVKMEDNLAWSYPWVNAENCLELTLATAKSLPEQLNDFLRLVDLHPIYVAAQELAEKYRIENYVRDYVVPAIKARL